MLRQGSVVVARPQRSGAKTKRPACCGPWCVCRVGGAFQRSRRILSNSSRIRQAAPMLMAMSARLKAGKWPR